MKVIKSLLTTIQSLLLLYACIFLLNACKNDNPFINSSEKYDMNTENYRDLFKYVWKVLDKSYIFWDIKPTDWNEVYRRQFHKFQTLHTGMKNHHLDQKNLEQARKLFEETMGKTHRQPS